MKIITLLLMMLSIGVAQAKVYKCPGKIEGQYVYQGVPCKGAKADEHTVKIIPADEKKIAEAQAKLAKEIDAGKEKKEPATVLMSIPTNAVPAAGSPPPANNSNAANASNAAPANAPANPNPAPPAAQPTTAPIPR